MEGIKKNLLFLLLLVFVGAGIWQIVEGGRLALEAKESSDWPTTEGAVLSANVKVSAGSSGARKAYTPLVTYSYAVQGENLIGHVITPGIPWSLSLSQEAVQAFPKGSHPLVYYSPLEPTRSVLVSGLHPYNLAVLDFGLMVTTLAGTIGVITVLAQCFGIKIKSDGNGNFSLPSNSPLGVLFAMGIAAFIVEAGFFAWITLFSSL